MKRITIILSGKGHQAKEFLEAYLDAIEISGKDSGYDVTRIRENVENGYFDTVTINRKEKYQKSCLRFNSTSDECSFIIAVANNKFMRWLIRKSNKSMAKTFGLQFSYDYF